MTVFCMEFVGNQTDLWTVDPCMLFKLEVLKSHMSRKSGLPAEWGLLRNCGGCRKLCKQDGQTINYYCCIILLEWVAQSLYRLLSSQA